MYLNTIDLQKKTVAETNVQVFGKSRKPTENYHRHGGHTSREMPSLRYYSTGIALYESYVKARGAPQSNEIRVSKKKQIIKNDSFRRDKRE